MHHLHLVHKPGIAIVGGESLLGKEIHELLEDSGIKAEVRLIASGDPGEEGSILTRGREEPLVMTSLQAADLGTAKLIVLAGPKESGLRAYEQVRDLKAAPIIVDVTAGLEDLPDARLRAPIIEPREYVAEGKIQVVAHPAAVALALFLTQVRGAGAIQRAVAEVFEPASERGQAGIDELQKQTVGLLSFKPLSKEVYDAQVSFNLLSQYGSESPHSLEAIELKIDRHLASLLATAGVVPMPSLRLVQAPVFHGYSISVWVEFEKNTGKDAIVNALATGSIDLRAGDEEPPTNVGVAGQGGITVGSIVPDRNQPLAWWFWIAADNFRIAGESAVEVIRGSLA